jgi:NtrC-family two-component system sensor histidine kinase KinB
VTRALGLRSRLLLWGVLLVVMTALPGLVGALTFARVSRTMSNALSGDRNTAQLVHTLTSALEDEDDALLLSLLGEGALARQDLATERRRFDEAFSQLFATVTDADERASLVDLRTSVAAYRASSDDILAMEGRGSARERYRVETTPLLRRAVAACTRLREHSFDATQAITATARDEAAQATWVASATSLGALMLLGFVAWSVASTVLRPLHDLTESVDAVRREDFTHRVEPRADDELGRLTHAFNDMTAALRDFRASRLGDVLAANQALEATLEALPEAVLVLGTGDAITRSNARARELLGGPDGTPRSITDVPLPVAALDAIALARSGERASNPSRTDLGSAMSLMVDGSSRLFVPRVVGVGETVAVVLDEVTEFARLDEMRTEFVAAAAHELRTPLTTLRMTLALLDEAASSLTPQQREMLDTAKLGCRQLGATVDAFLDLTRIEAGPLSVARDRVDLRMLVLEVTRALRITFADSSIALEVDEGSTAVIIEGDRARMSAALSNLLTNARKYCPSGGNVAVRLLRGDPDGHVNVIVDDDGPGVPPDLRERVFDRYFRVEHLRPDTAPGAHGAGIGLYLCRQVVEGHGGRVRCEASPSGGARLVVELPVVRPSLAP